MATSYYTPGVCNINPEEAAYRMKTYYISLLIGLPLFFMLIILSAPFLLGIVMFVPAWTAALSYFQASTKFCITYAEKGIYNVDDTYGKTQAVTYKKSITKDIARAMQIKRDSILIGLLAAVGSVFFLFVF